MSFAHLTLPTRDVARTAAFLERVLRCGRNPTPANSPVEVVWLDLGLGQELHVIDVAGFAASEFEGEFGRHVALYHPLADFEALKQRVTEAGGALVEPLRTTPYARLFFREPVNGYVFEAIDEARRRA